jgi:NAD(P)-dependent dehydrogenase (short-subunit alcohol dehydrogenase family)
MIGRLLDILLDETILFSFDRMGYERHARAFRPEDLAEDLSGRVCLVTGANSGIGRATALQIARRGAELWLLCRDEERGREAQEALCAESGNERIRFAQVDLSRLTSVRDFVAKFQAKQVDVLVHNAGVLPAERHETEDGIELTLATNVIGPYLLTRLLEPKLRAAHRARVIFVSSGGMYPRRLSLADPNWREREFDGVLAYAQTKRMQVVLAELFAERWSDAGIVVHSMHPGWADTPSVRDSLPRFWSLMQSRLRTPEQGADTVVWLAAAPAAAESSGKFWFDRAPRRTHLLPFTRENAEDRRALWELCERRTGLDAAPERARPVVS